jgi:predicted Zn-ribbon and HTH transcriptional regulator
LGLQIAQHTLYCPIVRKDGRGWLGLANRLADRKKSRKRRYIDHKQRRQAQRAIQKQIDEAVAKAVIEAIERALQDEVTELLGRAKSERRNEYDVTLVEARCNKCGCRYRRQFYRGGSYARGILAFEAWGEIKVPRIRCLCDGVVDFEFVHLVPYGRLWFDLEERARELAGICVSLRDGVRVLAWCNGQPLSIATVNGLVNDAAALAESLHAGKLTRVPAVVMLDGIWLKVLEPTGEWYSDKKGRRRQRTKLKKFPLLVAYGVDPVSGERWLLDWERGRDEDEGSWRILLERLLARGLHAEGGLEVFVHDGSAGLEKAFEMVYFGQGVERQRCIFHTIRTQLRTGWSSGRTTQGDNVANLQHFVFNDNPFDQHLQDGLLFFKRCISYSRTNPFTKGSKAFEHLLCFYSFLTQAQPLITLLNEG